MAKRGTSEPEGSGTGARETGSLFSVEQAVERKQIKRFIAVLNKCMIHGQISQRDLSARLKITIGTLTKYLRGEVPPFNIKTSITASLAEELGVTSNALHEYYRTGNLKQETPVSLGIEDVGRWIRSSAGQGDLLLLMEHMAAAQARMLEPGSTSLTDVRDIVDSRPKKVVTYSDQGAESFCNAMAEAFSDAARDAMLTPQQAWAELDNRIEFPDQFVPEIKDVLRGAKIFTGSELTAAMKMLEGECLVIKALEAWTGSEHKPLRKAFAAAAKAK